MTRRSVVANILAVALTVAPAALVRGHQEEKQPAAPPLPKPATEMAQLKVFDGNWTCQGNAPATPMGPAHTFRTTVKSQTDLGGFWQSGLVKSTSTVMPPLEGMFHMTYDPGGKRYVLLWVDNMGGWTQETSAGWEGDNIVFAGEGNMSGQRIMVRDTFVKNRDGSLRHAAEMQMDGKWASMGEETCRKTN